MLHADWHPGNMVFRDGTVAAVLDFDGARLGPVLLDIASGSLQFSMTRVGVNPDDWPDGLDAHRFAAFLRGYGPEAIGAGLRSLPAMMGAALVGEVVAPVAATGTFAGRDPGPFLRMVCRKTAWLIENASKLESLAKRSARAG
ncbi:MAG: phosphotransferase [Planctomycetota bacterium]|nr:MAG: phosphotransferase [Planctomycetota bacterium]